MREVLVVDLDGTLLRSDILFESFWAAFARDWKTPILSVHALMKGKAALKRRLAETTTVDVSSLPYDPEVIAYVKEWRAQGGRTALVTASDNSIAQAIAAHIGLFDEVYGSDGDKNLKGARKAEFLVKSYGEKEFSYVGDAEADLNVWKHAKRAVTVNLSPAMQARAEKTVDSVEHLETHKPSIAAYFRAIRPHQWMKNTLVFLPMMAAHQLDARMFFLSLLAFISFSLVASSVYVLNDLLDLSADRAHPRKRFRPFAAGSIPIAAGTWMAPVLLGLGVAIAIIIGPTFLLVMVGYYILTTAYSLHLKRRIVVDICVLAGLYTTRIIAGGAATGIALSVWLLAFSVFFFLSLAAVKRQAEMVDNVGQGKLKASGRGYHVNDLPIISMISISAGYVAVLVMALYVNSPTVIDLYGTPEMLWGVCAILLYWITRTVLITHRGSMHDDPVVYAVKDRQSRICFLLILCFVVVGAMV